MSFAGSPVALTPEAANAALTVVLAHGRGGSTADMAELAVRLAVPGVRYLLLAAPGGTWYPQRFLAALADNEPWLSASLAHYAEVVDGLIAGGLAPGRLVLGGFSQGACLTAEFLVRHPRRYGGAVILTGGLIGPPGTRWPAAQALAGVPVYLSGSEIDEWVPVARVDETATVLRDSGADVTLRVFQDRAHLVGEEEVASVRELLTRAAATAGEFLHSSRRYDAARPREEKHG